MTKQEFRDALDTYCSLTHASVTSYYRTPRHNQAVDGKPHSPHLVWLGADITYDPEVGAPSSPEWAERLGLKLIRGTDHDHLQPRDWVPG